MEKFNFVISASITCETEEEALKRLRVLKESMFTGPWDEIGTYADMSDRYPEWYRV